MKQIKKYTFGFSIYGYAQHTVEAESYEEAKLKIKESDYEFDLTPETLKKEGLYVSLNDVNKFDDLEIRKKEVVISEYIPEEFYGYGVSPELDNWAKTEDSYLIEW